MEPLPRRRPSLRAPGHDYGQPGAYFVTICAHRGQCLFGAVQAGDVALSYLGQLAWDCWSAIPRHHPHVRLDAFVVMPNHVHGILWLEGQPPRQTDDAPEPHTGKLRRFGHSQAGSLSTVVGTFKAAVSRSARREGYWDQELPLWQRNFWDRVIRSEQALQAIRRYIRDNPRRWQEDVFHPQAPPNRFNRTWGTDE